MTIEEQTDILKQLYSNETSSAVQPYFDNVKTVADNITKVVILADAVISSYFQINADNIDDIKANASQIDNINTLVNIKDTLISLGNDKTKLVSLYDDKVILDEIYALRDKLSSIYTDKTKLDSLYTDKSKLDAIYLKLNEITIAVENIDDIQNASTNALNAKTFRDEAEEFRNQTQILAGGEVLANMVKFSDNVYLEEYRNTLTNTFDTKVNITDIRDTLTSTETNKPLAANQGKVLKDLITSIQTVLVSDNSTLDSFQELVDYIEQNRETLQTLSISNIAGLVAALADKANINHTHALKTINGQEISGTGDIETPTVSLSSAIDSDSEIEAATSLAVKIVNDKAVEALNATNISTLDDINSVVSCYTSGSTTLNSTTSGANLFFASGSFTLTGTWINCGHMGNSIYLYRKIS